MAHTAAEPEVTHESFYCPRLAPTMCFGLHVIWLELGPTAVSTDSQYRRRYSFLRPEQAPAVGKSRSEAVTGLSAVKYT